MKSFLTGLLVILILGLAGFYTFKATTSFMNKLNPTPSSSAIALASADPIPTPSPKPTPTPVDDQDYVPTTKGDLPIKTTTTTYTTLTLIRSNTCPISYTSEVSDITTPLTLRYSLKDGYSFGITVWNRDGNELLANTTYSGNSGNIKTISGVDYMKVRVESKSCPGNSDNWLTLTAEN